VPRGETTVRNLTEQWIGMRKSSSRYSLSHPPRRLTCSRRFAYWSGDCVTRSSSAHVAPPVRSLVSSLRRLQSGRQQPPSLVCHRTTWLRAQRVAPESHVHAAHDGESRPSLPQGFHGIWKLASTVIQSRRPPIGWPSEEVMRSPAPNDRGRLPRPRQHRTAAVGLSWLSGIIRV
jgi:hypothetical protein